MRPQRQAQPPEVVQPASAKLRRIQDKRVTVLEKLNELTESHGEPSAGRGRAERI
jgi:hypothetical protein